MEEKLQTDDTKLYHERQVKELCALHALNNLFQTKEAFTKKELDEICNKLSPGSFINPHRSVLGFGNYDVNVLMAALQKRGYETVWFDKRKDVDVLIMDNIMGFILNTPTDYKLGFVKLPIHRKHWIAIRYLQGQYMNLDSKLDAPTPIGDESSLLRYLRGQLWNGEKELLLVVEPNVYENSLWRKDTVQDSTTSLTALDNEIAEERLREVVPCSDDRQNDTQNGGIDQIDNTLLLDEDSIGIKSHSVPLDTKDEELVKKDHNILSNDANSQEVI